MYGCLKVPDSETAGTFRGGADGVRMPFVSPTNFGLSSQLEEKEDPEGAGLSSLFSGMIVETEVDFSLVFSVMMMGGLAEMTVGAAGATLASILGGGTPLSCSKGIS